MATQRGHGDDTDTRDDPGASAAGEPGLLRTDEDRVEEPTTESGGQMRQSGSGERLGWPKASRVRSEMADDSRENAVELRDEDGD